MRITKIEQPCVRNLYRDEYEVDYGTCAENPVEVWHNA